MTTVVDTVPVTAPLVVLRVLTEDQRERLETLAAGFKATKVSLMLDSWNQDNVIFTLYGPEPNQVILHGLIEPDGSANT